MGSTPCRDARILAEATIGRPWRMPPTGLDVPRSSFHVPPRSLPHGRFVAVGGLELLGLDHAEAPARLGAKGVD